MQSEEILRQEFVDALREFHNDDYARLKQITIYKKPRYCVYSYWRGTDTILKEVIAEVYGSGLGWKHNTKYILVKIIKSNDETSVSDKKLAIYKTWATKIYRRKRDLMVELL